MYDTVQRPHRIFTIGRVLCTIPFARAGPFRWPQCQRQLQPCTFLFLSPYTRITSHARSLTHLFASLLLLFFLFACGHLFIFSAQVAQFLTGTHLPGEAHSPFAQLTNDPVIVHLRTNPTSSSSGEKKKKKERKRPERTGRSTGRWRHLAATLPTVVERRFSIDVFAQRRIQRAQMRGRNNASFISENARNKNIPARPVSFTTFITDLSKSRVL